jgi:hypothetical protein
VTGDKKQVREFAESQKGGNFGNIRNQIMKIEVSNGEIIDKLTIIKIKLERIKESSKLKNLQKEYDILKAASSEILGKDDSLYKSLYDINCELWDIEDRIRDLERKKDFGRDFIETARLVYINNDKRSEIKREINLRTSSGLIEEKSYEKY